MFISNQTVPRAKRQAWDRLSAVWIAIGSELSSMLLGVRISSGLSFGRALAGVFVGSLILAGVSTACAWVGRPRVCPTPADPTDLRPIRRQTHFPGPRRVPFGLVRRP